MGWAGLGPAALGLLCRARARDALQANIHRAARRPYPLTKCTRAVGLPGNGQRRAGTSPSARSRHRYNALLAFMRTLLDRTRARDASPPRSFRDVGAGQTSPGRRRYLPAGRPVAGGGDEVDQRRSKLERSAPDRSADARASLQAASSTTRPRTGWPPLSATS